MAGFEPRERVPEPIHEVFRPFEARHHPSSQPMTSNDDLPNSEIIGPNNGT